MTDTAGPVDTDVEPCSWLVGRDTYWRPCGKPSTFDITRDQLTARVCQRHRVRALEHGWHDGAEP